MRNVQKTSAIWLIFAILGAGFLLYPTLSKQVNQKRSDQEVKRYEDLNEARDIPETARQYNEILKESGRPESASEKVGVPYEKLLTDDPGSPIGTLEIKKIALNLPIYAGSSDDVLDRGIGHVEWSSLPIGGPGTHTVLSGHRGLPSARLFTDLDQMEQGDRFRIRVGNSVLEYETDEIRVVLPNEVESLRIQDNEDLCTLVTCTPYGINTHRLLVRGHRVPLLETTETDGEAFRANGIDPLIRVSLISLAVLCTGFGLTFLVIKLKKKRSDPPLSEREYPTKDET